LVRETLHPVAIVVRRAAALFFTADTGQQITVGRETIGAFVTPLLAIGKVFVAPPVVAMVVCNGRAPRVVVEIVLVSAIGETGPGGRIARIVSAIIVVGAAGAEFAADGIVQITVSGGTVPVGLASCRTVGH
jgi:hypothetical protein